MEIFIAAVVSVVVQLVKKRFGTSMIMTTVVLIGLSLLAGLGMWYLQSANYWETAVQVTVMGAGVWALVLKKLEA